MLFPLRRLETRSDWRSSEHRAGDEYLPLSVAQAHAGISKLTWLKAKAAMGFGPFAAPPLVAAAERWNRDYCRESVPSAVALAATFLISALKFNGSRSGQRDWPRQFRRPARCLFSYRWPPPKSLLSNRPKIDSLSLAVGGGADLCCGAAEALCRVSAGAGDAFCVAAAGAGFA